MHDLLFMKEAYVEAVKAYAIEETPIGAVLVYKDEIIARGYNQRNIKKNPLAHAEISVINEGAKVMGDWRLEECTLYVTLEPCPMCAGAIVQSRIERVVFGAANYKSGSAGTVINLLNVGAFNHQVEVISGVMEDECSQLMKDFFKDLRKRK